MATPDPAVIAAVTLYLAQSGLTYSEETITQALTAEQAAQAALCRVGDPIEDDLAEALRRRVARNLAMRALPIGVLSDEMGSTPIGAIDPEVRRLEKPYRKVFVG